VPEGSKPNASDPEEVLSFWFPEEDLLTADVETLQRQVRWWMRGGPEVDREIVERFSAVFWNKLGEESSTTGPRPHAEGWP
jgi:hypothetical protein